MHQLISVNMGSEKSSENNLGIELEKNKSELKAPSLYRVCLLNDDYTPMDFVVFVLKCYFGFDENKAYETMMQVHCSGKAVCGVFTHEIAETKVNLVNEYASYNEHPLLCVMEQVD